MNRLRYDCYRGWCAKAASTLTVAALSISFTVQSASSDAVHDGSGAHGNAAPCELQLRPDADLFLKENDAAIQCMMPDMMVPPSGSINHDFAVMMIAHHRGAIDTAETYLRSGSNPALLRMTQEIIVTQQQDIAILQRATGAEPPQASGGAE